MKVRGTMLFSVLLIGAFLLGACAPTASAPATEPAAAPTTAPAADKPTEAAAQPAATEKPADSSSGTITLEYWVFSDYAQGEAGELQKTFISEFEAANPGVKINLSGKNDDELSTGVVAAAASGTLPDIFMNGDEMGSKDVNMEALANLYDRWIAMPESFRSQFNKTMIADMTPEEKVMYGMPYTGYSNFLYRNLTVLKKAGIDPNEKVETWDAWLAQMKKIKDAGLQALPTFSDHYNDTMVFYSGVATADEWGIDWANKKTKIVPEKYAQEMKFLLEAKKYGSEVGNRDQAAMDLFISNQLAYKISGPWTNVTLLEAQKNSGLEYDYVVLPGATADNPSGVRGIEFLGLSPTTKNADVAWKFITYICDEPQMTRWATLLARFNSNEATLAKVKDPLLDVTVEAAKSALTLMPPAFVKPYPDAYAQAIIDNMVAIESGQISPDDGAKELVQKLNEIIAAED